MQSLKLFSLPRNKQSKSNNLEQAFTLIELMISISIMAILGSLSIAGFNSFNQVQVLKTSTAEVATMLDLARSRAQSQIKPPGLCSSTNTLGGYLVKIVSNKNYALFLRCSGSGASTDVLVSEENRNLPSGLVFSSPVPAVFFFPVLTGELETPGTIVVCNSQGKARTITINSLAVINVQTSICTYTPPT